MMVRRGIITLMTSIVKKVDKEAEEQELRDAFTELGSDLEMSNVGFAFQAQAEVALYDGSPDPTIF